MLEAITHPEIVFNIILSIAIFGVSYVVFGLVSDGGKVVNDKFIKSDKQKRAEEAKKKKAS